MEARRSDGSQTTWAATAVAKRWQRWEITETLLHPSFFFILRGNGGGGFPCQPNESNDFRQINSVFVTSSAARHVPKIFLPSEALT